MRRSVLGDSAAGIKEVIVVDDGPQKKVKMVKKLLLFIDAMKEHT